MTPSIVVVGAGPAGLAAATEAATAALAYAFHNLKLREVVSFAAVTNRRSQAVMHRLGMTHTPQDDFLHPNLPEGHPLRPHVLYRTSSDH